MGKNMPVITIFSFVLNMELREYQKQVKQQIQQALSEGKRRLLIVMPTGAGKTTQFADFICDVLEDERFSTLVVAHRQELIDQPFKRLQEFGLTSGIVMGKQNNQQHQSVIASIQTLARRKLFIAPNYIIIDECHRANGATYQKLLNQYPEAVVLGFTATPVRTDGKYLDLTFEVLIQGPTIAELTEWGYLVPAICYGPQEVDTSNVGIDKGDFDSGQLYSLFDKPTLYAGTVKYWQQYAEGRTTIVFCQSVEHSKKVMGAFQDAGIRAAHLDGETPDWLRKSIFSELNAGTIDVVCNFGIAVEGVDIPRVSCIVLDMATLSLSKYLQGVGRGLRTFDSKDDCIVIDHGGNVKRHGFPSAEREWKLSGKMKKPGVAPVKECPECYLLCHSSVPACPDCGYVWPKKVEAPTEAEFVVLVPVELQIPPDEMSISQLAEAAKYNGGLKWVLKQLRIRVADDMKAQLEGMKFASGAEYVATKKQMGKALYLSYLQVYGAIKQYSDLWAKQQVQYY
jgi:DNA repair protein RadD